MNKCSSYEYINFKNGILDNIVDAVYVILLENSDRKKSVLDQIYKYKLSKINILQVNKYYKDCIDKSLCKQSSNYHLLNNTINILKHANKHNYNNILIFEDDFILSPEIRNKKIINDIEEFIKFNDFNLYFLGVLPILFHPVNMNTMKLIYFLTTHSIIYSKSVRNILIKKYEKDNCINGDRHIDGWYNNLSKKYMYKFPLCFQSFQNTENRKEWDNNIKSFLIEKLNLDTKNKKILENSYRNIYYICYIVYFIIILIISKYIFRLL
tara:strand:- start:2288 stop:3088 length:801 start_codon:yes stop_codon:yes gene_type:complete